MKVLHIWSKLKIFQTQGLGTLRKRCKQEEDKALLDTWLSRTDATKPLTSNAVPRYGSQLQ